VGSTEGDNVGERVLGDCEGIVEGETLGFGEGSYVGEDDGEADAEGVMLGQIKGVGRNEDVGVADGQADGAPNG